MCGPFYLCMYTFAKGGNTSEMQCLCEQASDDKSEPPLNKPAAAFYPLNKMFLKKVEKQSAKNLNRTDLNS